MNEEEAVVEWVTCRKEDIEALKEEIKRKMRRILDAIAGDGDT